MKNCYAIGPLSVKAENLESKNRYQTLTASLHLKGSRSNIFYEINLEKSHYFWGGAWYGQKIENLRLEGTKVLVDGNQIPFTIQNPSEKTRGFILSVKVVRSGSYSLDLTEAFLSGTYWSDQDSKIKLNNLKTRFLTYPIHSPVLEYKK